jgi:hypothetical protein
MNVHETILEAVHNPIMNSLSVEIATTAARMVVEEGLEYGAAKHQAVKQMGLSSRSALPDNNQLEMAVEAYIALYCGDSQPSELRALRELALVWMERLAEFRPMVSGAVWHGTATRHTDIQLQLFCEDSKIAEIALIDMHVPFESRQILGIHRRGVEVLSFHVYAEELDETVGLHLAIYDLDDIRGALQPDARGRSPRGDRDALRTLMKGQTP